MNNNQVDLINRFQSFLKSHLYIPKDDDYFYRFDYEKQLLFAVRIQTVGKFDIYFGCMPLASLEFYPDGGAPSISEWNTVRMMVWHYKSYQHTSLEEQLTFFYKNIFPSFNALDTTEAALKFNQKIDEFLNLKFISGTLKTPFAWLYVNKADEAIHFCEHNIAHFEEYLINNPSRESRQGVECSIRTLSEIKKNIQADTAYYQEEIRRTILENQERLGKYLSTCRSVEKNM